MSYAMCLDNSWDVMCEEEMYDVNGGGWFTSTLKVVGGLTVLGGGIVIVVGCILGAPETGGLSLFALGTGISIIGAGIYYIGDGLS